MTETRRARLQLYKDLTEQFLNKEITPPEYCKEILALYHTPENDLGDEIDQYVVQLRNAAEDFDYVRNPEVEWWIDEAGLRKICAEQLPNLKMLLDTPKADD